MGLEEETTKCLYFRISHRDENDKESFGKYFYDKQPYALVHLQSFTNSLFSQNFLNRKNIITTTRKAREHLSNLTRLVELKGSNIIIDGYYRHAYTKQEGNKLSNRNVTFKICSFKIEPKIDLQFKDNDGIEDVDEIETYHKQGQTG